MFDDYIDVEEQRAWLWGIMGGALRQTVPEHMRDNPRADHANGLGQYYVKTCSPDVLTPGELADCVAIVKSGNAVNPESAKKELPRARVLALATIRGKIVGVGAIKQVRQPYACGIAGKSREAFAPDTPELGYVAVDSRHQGNGLSHRIVAALLSTGEHRLFATTDNDRMKSVLTKAGFTRKGNEWEGHRGRLSLWIRDG